MKIKIQTQPCGLTDFYEKAAKKYISELSEGRIDAVDFSEYKFDCRKIDISQNIQDMFYEYYTKLVKENDGTMHDFGLSPQRMWDQCYKNHPNVLMIASGHVGTTKPVFSVRRGAEGNVVREILVDPQNYDIHRDADGSPISGIQDTGMVLYLNFSADGKSFTCNYYSTLLNKEMVGVDKTYTLYPYSKSEKKEPATKAAAATVSPSSYTPVQLTAQSPVLPVVCIAGTVAVLVGCITLFFLSKRKKK